MFTKIADFEKAWLSDTGGTQKMMDALTDKSLSQSVAADHRTLARMAWHIVTSIPEMMSKTGLEVKSVKADAPVPSSAEEIKNSYAAASKELLNDLKSKWDDDALQIEDDLYGQTWQRGRTLRIMLDHEIHHRGQMTVLMRQAGLKVPGIYGPSKEEWVAYGMEEPPI